MTQLPAMKILDEPGNYFERVLKALFELGCEWITGGSAIKNTHAIALFVDSKGRITYIDSDDLRPQEYFMEDSRPAFRLASNGNLVPQRADDEGWMPHDGGECPVDEATTVDVHLENGHNLYGHRAGDRTWNTQGKPSLMLAITYYRVPSQVFATSQAVSSCATPFQRKPEPVHQIKHSGSPFEGKWVWSNGGGYNPGEHGDPQWVRVVGCEIKDSGQFLYTCEWDDGKRLSMFDHEIDWTAGVYDQKPNTEDDMGRTLTAAEALCGPVAEGFEAGSENPWEELQAYDWRDGSWEPVISAMDFAMCVENGVSCFRRKPHTVQLKGEISEKTVETLRYWKSLGSSTKQARNLDAAIDEILSTVES